MEGWSWCTAEGGVGLVCIWGGGGGRGVALVCGWGGEG